MIDYDYSGILYKLIAPCGIFFGGGIVILLLNKFWKKSMMILKKRVFVMLVLF